MEIVYTEGEVLEWWKRSLITIHSESSKGENVVSIFLMHSNNETFIIK